MKRRISFAEAWTLTFGTFLIALVIFLGVLTLSLVLSACHKDVFPECKDPKQNCAPVSPDYPAGGARDAGPLEAGSRP